MSVLDVDGSPSKSTLRQTLVPKLHAKYLFNVVFLCKKKYKSNKLHNIILHKNIIALQWFFFIHTELYNNNI